LLPDKVSAFQLFTYHLGVIYPFYQTPDGFGDVSPGCPVWITLGIGVYLD